MKKIKFAVAATAVAAAGVAAMIGGAGSALADPCPSGYGTINSGGTITFAQDGGILPDPIYLDGGTKVIDYGTNDDGTEELKVTSGPYTGWWVNVTQGSYTDSGPIPTCP